MQLEAFSLFYVTLGLIIVYFCMNLLLKTKYLATGFKYGNYFMIGSVGYYLIEAFSTYADGSLAMVVYRYFFVTSDETVPNQVPLFSSRIGTLTGILSLCFSIQQDTVSLLNSGNKEDKPVDKLNVGYLISLSSAMIVAILGSITFSYLDTESLSLPTLLVFSSYKTILDAFKDNNGFSRFYMSLITCLQILLAVPLYSYICSCSVATF